ncbi:MAG: hypothetical protein U1E65_30955 [Myxococcota bacterium]
MLWLLWVTTASGPSLDLRPELVVADSVGLGGGGSVEVALPMWSFGRLFAASRADFLLGPEQVLAGGLSSTAETVFERWGLGAVLGTTAILPLADTKLELSVAGGLHFTHVATHLQACSGSCTLAARLPAANVDLSGVRPLFEVGLAVVVPLSALSELDLSCTLQLMPDTGNLDPLLVGHLWVVRSGVGVRFDPWGAPDA